MQPISRRRFFGVASAVTAAVALPSWTASAIAGTSSATKLTRSAFAKYVGATFRMSDATFGGNVVLSSVDDIAGAVAGDENRFALLFTAPSSSVTAPQGVYTFRQKAFGSADLFVVPVDRGVSARLYQAIVNRTS